MIHFAAAFSRYALLDPWMLFLLAFPAWALLRRRRGGPAVRFSPAPLLFHAPGAAEGGEGTGTGPRPASRRVRLRALPRWLRVAALVLAAGALARPVVRERMEAVGEGMDILLCLDVSSSMKARDMERGRTRLEVARSAAAKFVEGRPGDRIGILAFARYPDLLCPPTGDHESLLEILAGIEPVEADGPEDATGIGLAAARAAQVLGGAGAGSRVAILFTDGEENVATARRPEEIAPLHAAQLCEAMGVRVYVIAAGTGRVDASGNPVPLDTSPVEPLVRRTGGRLFEARDAAALEAVYHAIDDLEKARRPGVRYRVEDTFLLLLVPSLLLWFAGLLLEGFVLEVWP